MISRNWLIVVISAVAQCLVGSPVSADVVAWNETTSGDLSNNQAAPTPITGQSGLNSVIGSVAGTPDRQDWLALTVPSGFVLSSILLSSYNSTDAQGFTGVQSGPAFIGSTGVAGSYLGYAHFGTGATNGALPATNLVGSDILPIMGDTTLAAGSAGFTPPLPSGTYTFLIQQTGAATTSYQFDYGITPVPEPGALALMGMGLLLAGRKFRRVRTVCRSAAVQRQRVARRNTSGN